MNAKCECGHEFEVPDGTQAAKCPRRGREIEVTAGEDWLSQLDMDSLALEGGPPAAEEEQEPAPQEPPPQRVAFEEGAAQPEPAALELGDLELDLESGGPQAARAPGAAPAPPRRTAPRTARRERQVRAKAKAKEPPPPPKTVGAFWTLLKDDPNKAVPHLTEGIKDKQFVVQAAVTLGVLSLLGAASYGWMTKMTSAAVGVAIGGWIWMLLELAAACVMFNLVGRAFKREARPLGISEALALGRIGSLILAAPIALICLVILVTCRFMDPPPEAMFRA
ncbi:MAG: hypothetical protein ACYTFZ_11285, partial [Planctomycetota bacterium]